MSKELANLMEYIKTGVTAFHAIDYTKKELERFGFQSLDSKEKWTLQSGGKYYVSKNDSSLIAFIYGENVTEKGFRIVASHSDSPSLRLKPNPVVKANKYVKLNVEVYGGPILDTWFDRPLGIAGRVMVKGNSVFSPEAKLLSFDEPIGIIPNLAIHMQRGKDSDSLSKQRDLQAIIALNQESFSFEEKIAEKLNIKKEEILDYDLFLYEYTDPCTIGFDQSLLSAPRLDNLAMAHASIEALTKTEPSSWTNMCVIFDNEEVGNRTKQGAASPWLRNVIERIVLQSSSERDDYFRALEHSFLLSADLAHAVHPNRPDKHDPINQPKLNEGPVIKISANQAYTSDSDSIAVFETICLQNNIPIQKFVNHSDQPGGSTIGPTNTTQLPIRAVDIGNPCLAMHSTRELAGTKDHEFMIQAMKAFYETK